MTQKEREAELERLTKAIMNYRMMINLPHGFKEQCRALAEYLIYGIGVIVPPCKVGEVLHQFDPDGNFYQMNVTGLLIRTSDRPLVVMTDAVDFDADLIGTCFFTTKEQAENAYKERENQ